MLLRLHQKLKTCIIRLTNAPAILIGLFTILCTTTPAKAQTAEVIKLPALINLLSLTSDTTYLVNFMATWCKPCMEELPYFEKVKTSYKDKKVKIVYISLNAVTDLHKKLNPMLQRRQITTQTYLLDEPNYNSWIDKIEPTWDGAIPVTIVYQNQSGFRKFIPSATTYESLIETLNHVK